MFFLKRIFQRSLFSLTPLTPSSSPSPFSIFIAQCSTSPPSLLNDSHVRSQPASRKEIVSVWWDFENCNVPSDLKEFSVRKVIKNALNSIGIRGDVFISAVGDIYQISSARRDDFAFTGVEVVHVTQDEKESADKFLNIRLNYWLQQNPPPAHVFFITGDKDFAATLHRLRMSKYNILLATKEKVHGVLKSAASVMWMWSDVVRQKQDLRGQYFNQPPDEVWYNSYEEPLVDPFTIIHRPAYPCELLITAADDHELFSEESFWRELQNFLKTDMGFFLLSESISRGNLAWNLHNYGPSDVKTLTRSDVLRMVIIMLLEKKLVLELFAGTSSGVKQYHYMLSTIN